MRPVRHLVTLVVLAVLCAVVPSALAASSARAAEAVQCPVSAAKGRLTAQSVPKLLRNEGGQTAWSPTRMVAFTIADVDPNSEYSVAFGDGRFARLFVPTSGVFRHNYATHGEKTATLTIRKPGCVFSLGAFGTKPYVQRSMTIVVNPVLTYAPTIVLHPGETYFPDSVDDFLDASVLIHDLPNFRDHLTSDDCRDNVIARGPDVDLDRFQDRRGNTRVKANEPLLKRNRLGTNSGNDAYHADEYKMRTIKNVDFDDCTKIKNSRYRAHDGDATKEGFFGSDDDGLVLSLAGAPDSVLRGDLSLDFAKLYVDYQPDWYVSYWIFYPYNSWRTNKLGKTVTEIHEGDWEHVTVRLGGPSSPTMREVGYFQHYCDMERHSRSELEDHGSLESGTHPLVYAAKGGHASYPWNQGVVLHSCGVNVAQGNGDVTGAGARFRPWRTLGTTEITTQLEMAFLQPWYGFEGAWGDPRKADYAKYGPKAPGGQGPGVSDQWPEGDREIRSAGDDYPSSDTPADIEDPILEKPAVALRAPGGRVVDYTLQTSDDVGVAEMRVKTTGDPDWRPWVTYHQTGTVVLRDRVGEHTVWFQVRDAAGHISTERAAENVNRVSDATKPTISAATVDHPGDDSRSATFTIAASDDLSDVTEMRSIVNGQQRDWVPFVTSGTVLLPDAYRSFDIAFQVRDGSGNESDPKAAGSVQRRAPVTLELESTDNAGGPRDCGDTEGFPCSDLVKKFATTVTTPAGHPDADLLLRAWRKIGDVWKESDVSPFLRSAIDGRTVVPMEITANLISGLWRFQASVPRTDATDFAKSEFQYLTIHDPNAPTITAAALGEDADTGDRSVAFTLAATDDTGVTEMRSIVNGNERGWVPYITSGTVLLPEDYGAFQIAFEVRDAAGNISAPRAAGTAYHRGAVSVALESTDNNGGPRDCGDTEGFPCSDLVKKFASTITSPAGHPNADLLLRAWRKVGPDSWQETTASPFIRSAIAGRDVVPMEIAGSMYAGLWRFQSSVPRTDATEFAKSEFQYLTISDTIAPTVDAVSVSHDGTSESASFSLSVTDDVGPTQMQVWVNDTPRGWVGYVPSGTVVLGGYGTRNIQFQVRDAAGNTSALSAVRSVTRRAPVTLTFVTLDGSGAVRTGCGSSEGDPCSSVAKKWRTTISSPAGIPDTNLLFHAERKVNGVWTETSQSPYLIHAINGQSSITSTITAKLIAGLWRFHTVVPVTGTTLYSVSGYQYMNMATNNRAAGYAGRPGVPLVI